jgi:hypothetical protein
MTTRKIIEINPELFKLPSNKTRKTRDKKELNLVPIVTANSLKNKLLKRIKEHKNKELNAKINTENYSSSKKNNSEIINNDTNNNYDDEFYGAINYLSDLSKKQKINAEKQRYQTNLNNKTLKQWSSPPIHHQNTNANANATANNEEFSFANVALNLPPELQKPTPINSNYFVPEKNDIINIKYRADNEIPYGCLKGGVKPSYKSWIQTRKNYQHPELENLPSVRPPTPPKKNTFIDDFSQKQSTSSSIMNETPKNTLSREERLEQIKQKLRLFEQQEHGNKQEFKSLQQDLNTLEPLLKENSLHNIQLNNEDDIKFEMPEILKDASSIDKKGNDSPKKYIKKTIRRKFTLGKSAKARKVAVLIKDNRTRKNIVNAQKELKKASISDIRKYLRKHGMIKAGSTAPHDILRKTFEYSMMAGDIRNTNKDTLLHNFIHEES